MKYIAILTIVALSFNTNAQLLQESGLYVFHKAVRQHATQEQIYTKALDWVGAHYNGENGFIKQRNDERGRIVVEGKMEHVVHGAPNTVQYTLVIETKGGVYREIYKDFSYKGKGGDVLPFESKKLSGKKKIVGYAGEKIASLSEDLIGYIASDVLATK